MSSNSESAVAAVPEKKEDEAAVVEEPIVRAKDKIKQFEKASSVQVRKNAKNLQKRRNWKSVKWIRIYKQSIYNDKKLFD